MSKSSSALNVSKLNAAALAKILDLVQSHGAGMTDCASQFSHKFAGSKSEVRPGI